MQAVDSNGRREELPGFDKTSISGGILFTKPALFFGMRDAYRDDKAWWREYRRAKARWLKDYRAHLRKGLAP